MQAISNIDKPADAFSYRERHSHHRDIIERILLIAEGFIVATITARFILALFGANTANSFAHFIFSFTNPFVNPFYGLFNYDHPAIGETVFEGYALIAIVIYSLIFSGLIKITQITRYQQ